MKPIFRPKHKPDGQPASRKKQILVLAVAGVAVLALGYYLYTRDFGASTQNTSRISPPPPMAAVARSGLFRVPAFRSAAMLVGVCTNWRVSSG